MSYYGELLALPHAFRQHTKVDRAAELAPYSSEYLRTLSEVEAVALAAGATHSPLMELLWQWFAAQIMTAPTVRVIWIQPDTTTARHAGDNAYALLDRGTVVVAPIVTMQHAVDASHELGHLRALLPININRLAGEVVAWEWAMTSMPLWTQLAHDRMRDSLAGYLAVELAANPKTPLHMAIADDICSLHTLRRHEKPEAAAIERFERLERERLQRTRCHGRYCGGAAAVRRVRAQVLCSKCAEAAEMDLTIAALKAARQHRSGGQR